MKNLIFVDVEAVGSTPTLGKMTEFGAVQYKTKETYHGRIYDGKPDPSNPAKPIAGRKLRPVHDVMLEFKQWIEANVKGRPIFVSDNVAYDWQWIAAAFDTCGMENPFGHSGRRISDFYAGLRYDFTKTQDWKKWRKTPHDHNPVNDAMGNVEAFEEIMKIVKEQNAA